MSATTTLAEQDEPAKSEKLSTQTTLRTALSSYRMLYRGSLALPDSEMLLDGIIFVMQIARNSPMSLINSPIPLGLESMRGRSLRLISTVSIQDTHVECFGDVSMYIHPEAFLTRSFFERTLCTNDPSAPLLPDDNFIYLRTTMAVRIGLGDGTGPDETDILVFGQLSAPTPAESLSHQSSSSSTTNAAPTERRPQILQLLAGRIAPPAAPQPQQPRKIARPDDPLPRSHPLANLRLSPGRRGIKRKRSTNPFGPFHSTSGDAKGNGSGDAGSALMVALAQAQAQGERLKKHGKVVPDAPVAKGLVKRPALFQHHHSATSTSTSTATSRGQSVDRDGFLVPGVPVHVLSVRRGDAEKGKSPLKGASGPNKGSGPDKDDSSQRYATSADSSNAAEPESETEGKNKTAIKKRTLAALEACGISKQHVQFRDMYGWIHRGVAFAVRGVIQDTKVDRDLLTKLIEVHLEMYMGGRGGKYQSQFQSQTQSSGSTEPPMAGGSEPARAPSPKRNAATDGLPADHGCTANGYEEDSDNDSNVNIAFGSRPLTLDQSQLKPSFPEVLFDVSSEHVQ